MALDFWKKHDRALRKNRITQAAAIIRSTCTPWPEVAVRIAFDLERRVSELVDKETDGSTDKPESSRDLR
jgi:hypothetical protein